MLWGKEVCLSLKNRHPGGPSTLGAISHALSCGPPDQEVVGPQGILIQVGAMHTQMWERGNWDCAELCWFVYAQILP